MIRMILTEEAFCTIGNNSSSSSSQAVLCHRRSRTYVNIESYSRDSSVKERYSQIRLIG